MNALRTGGWSRALAAVATAAMSLAAAACGSQATSTITDHGSSTVTVPLGTSGSLPQAHPQAVEPTPGVQATTTSTTSAPDSVSAAVGDPTAHAPPLSQVRRELERLNLCGGTTSPAEAAPIAMSAGPGFVADPGTNQTKGVLPELTARLNALGQSLGVAIYGISGYRTPAKSVSVGGFANDPHTLGEAEDIGVNSLLRASAAQISEADLARVGLYRPFDPSDDPRNPEVNHIQMIPAGGPLPVAQADAKFDPDPTCR